MSLARITGGVGREHPLKFGYLLDRDTAQVASGRANRQLAAAIGVDRETVRQTGGDVGNGVGVGAIYADGIRVCVTIEDKLKDVAAEVDIGDVLLPSRSIQIDRRRAPER